MCAVIGERKMVSETTVLLKNQICLVCKTSCDVFCNIVLNLCSNQATNIFMSFSPVLPSPSLMCFPMLICVCVYVCADACVCMCVHACMHACVCMCVCLSLCVCVCVCVCVCSMSVIGESAGIYCNEVFWLVINITETYFMCKVSVECFVRLFVKIMYALRAFF